MLGPQQRLIKNGHLVSGKCASKQTHNDYIVNSFVRTVTLFNWSVGISIELYHSGSKWCWVYDPKHTESKGEKDKKK